MGINHPPAGPDDVPAVIAVFPLSSALLLPRGELPLNVFEPRYIAMIDDAFKLDRIIGMIQPRGDNGDEETPVLHQVGCAGRITQIAETGDGRYMLTLTGLARFRIVNELSVLTPYRQCIVSYDEFATDFDIHTGESEVDRAGVLRALRDFAEANRLKIDWKGIEQTPNEALVNALAMMSPFGPDEKQALLVADTLRSRAEVLVAITEIELARGHGPISSLQ
ncbi:MAG: peptidase [Hyphomicrobiales bacterium]|nr:peptidase [Hyphomicrobiales bacterium]